MKSLMQFFTDGAIITLAIGLVVVAFLVTSSLSPIKFEESSFAMDDTQSVLGKAHLGELQFEPIQDNTTDLKVSQLKSDKSSISFSLQFDKLSAPAKIKLLRVSNSTSDNKALFLSAKSAQSIEQDLNITLRSDEFGTKLDLNASDQVPQTLQKGQTVEYEIIIEPNRPINFSSEIILEFYSE